MTVPEFRCRRVISDFPGTAWSQIRALLRCAAHHIADADDEIDVFGESRSGMSRSDGAGAQVPCQPAGGGSVGELACGGSGVYNAAYGVDPATERRRIVDGWLEGQFHALWSKSDSREHLWRIHRHRGSC